VSRYIVTESAAHMPSSCWGRYRRIAVLEVEDHVTHVKMISLRARGVIRVVRTWEKRADGLTERSAAGRARTEAIKLATELTEQRMRKADLALGWANAIGLQS
jgi:hypothetical protein